MPSAVVDASILASLYLNDPLTEVAESAMRELADDRVDLHAPDLIDYEVANVFIKAHRRGELDTEGCLSRIEAVLAWDVERHRRDRLVAAALSLGLAHDLSAYDAAYLALTVARGATLITGDRRLAERARAAGAAVRGLAPT